MGEDNIPLVSVLISYIICSILQAESTKEGGDVSGQPGFNITSNTSVGLIQVYFGYNSGQCDAKGKIVKLKVAAKPNKGESYMSCTLTFEDEEAE